MTPAQLALRLALDERALRSERDVWRLMARAALDKLHAAHVTIERQRALLELERDSRVRAMSEAATFQPSGDCDE